MDYERHATCPLFTLQKHSHSHSSSSQCKQTRSSVFTFNGLEGVLSSAQRRSEFGQYSELSGLPHCPLPQNCLGFQQCSRNYTWLAAIYTSSAIPFLRPLAAVVQTLQPGIFAVDTELWNLGSVTTVTLDTVIMKYTNSGTNWQHE